MSGVAVVVASGGAVAGAGVATGTSAAAGVTQTTKRKSKASAAAMAQRIAEQCDELRADRAAFIAGCAADCIAAQRADGLR
jgi:hypothetical protein